MIIEFAFAVRAFSAALVNCMTLFGMLHRQSFEFGSNIGRARLPALKLRFELI